MSFVVVLIFIYFSLHWLFVAVSRLSLLAASESCSPGAMHGLLIAVTSLVAGHRL